MQFFRAIPTFEVDTTKRSVRYETRRMPSNIPYFVDNLWEWLRPEGSPSRRHAVYASPTPALALKNASAGYLPKEDYTVLQLVFASPPLVHQLQEEDARDHTDIVAFQKVLSKCLGRSFASLPLLEKMDLSPLFIPGVSVEELTEAASRSEKLTTIMDAAKRVSTFWERAGQVDANSQGELFFELVDGNSYSLHPLE